MKSLSSGSVLRFGVFQVNLAARELRKHGVRIRLPGQPFCILSILLQKPGEVITREEIQRKLWSSDTFVDFEHSMNSAIKKLRAALGDSPEYSRYVETVPRVGYRFIAPVEQVSATANVEVSLVADRYAESAATVIHQIRRGPRPVSQGHVFLEQKDRVGVSAGDRVFSPSHNNRPQLRPGLCWPSEFLYPADRLFFCLLNYVHAPSARGRVACIGA